MPHALILGWAQRLWPPVGNFGSCVGMCRLLLWCNRLDPRFGNQFACVLLYLLEALVIEIPHFLHVIDSYAFLRGYGHCRLVIFANTSGNVGPLALSGPICWWHVIVKLFGCFHATVTPATPMILWSERHLIVGPNETICRLS